MRARKGSYYPKRYTLGDNLFRPIIEPLISNAILELVQILHSVQQAHFMAEQVN